MPWTNRPFDYYGTSPTQILDDLTKANDNFEILGQAFVGNDPTTQKAKDADKVDGYHASQTPSANTIPVADATGIIANAWLSSAIREFESPIDTVAYYNSTGTEYPLKVGEVAKISFSNVSSVPLRIATTSDTEYMLWLVPSNAYNASATNGPVYLNPNNTTYANAFGYVEVFANAGATSASGSSATYSAFRIGWGFSHALAIIRNLTAIKDVIGVSLVYGGSWGPPSIHVYDACWLDATTAWTSLGTIVFSQNSSGYVLVKRIL